MKHTRKKTPWAGWKNEKPEYKQKKLMLARCGKKCFLGSRKKFPICKKNTCRISKKGVYAAYIRSRQYKYHNISKKAKKMIVKMRMKH